MEGCLWWCWWLTGWLRLNLLQASRFALANPDRAFHEAGDFGRALDTNSHQQPPTTMGHRDNNTQSTRNKHRVCFVAQLQASPDFKSYNAALGNFTLVLLSAFGCTLHRVIGGLSLHSNVSFGTIWRISNTISHPLCQRNSHKGPGDHTPRVENTSFGPWHAVAFDRLQACTSSMDTRLSQW